jgi:hypothetical protein
MNGRATLKNTIASDMRRALTSRGFFAGVVGVVIVVAFSSLEDAAMVLRTGEPFPFGQHARFIIDALRSDGMMLTLPILCALPFTTAFVDDCASGFIKQYLPRSGTAAYIKGKLIACGLSGGFVLFFGVVFAYGVFALVLMPMEWAAGEGETTLPLFAEVLAKAAILFFSGAFWSLMGFVLAAMTMNRYMAYASPFILYYVLIILNERYLSGLYVLYPKEWLNPSGFWVMGDFGVIVLLCVLVSILCLGFAILAKRRISDVGL